MNTPASPADLALSNLLETLLETLRSSPEDGSVHAALKAASSPVVQATDQWKQRGASAAADVVELLRLAAREIKQLDENPDRSEVRLVGSCRRAMSQALLEMETAAGFEMRSPEQTSH